MLLSLALVQSKSPLTLGSITFYFLKELILINRCRVLLSVRSLCLEKVDCRCSTFIRVYTKSLVISVGLRPIHSRLAFMLALDVIISTLIMYLYLFECMHLSDMVIDVVREEFVGDKILERRIADEPLVEELAVEELSIRCLCIVLELLLVCKLEYISPALPSEVRGDVPTPGLRALELGKQLLGSVGLQNLFDHLIEFQLHLMDFQLHLVLLFLNLFLVESNGFVPLFP